MTRLITVFRGLVGVVLGVDAALSLLFLMVTECVWYTLAIFFVPLTFLSLWSLYFLFESRKRKEEGAVPLIVLPALAANGWLYVYLTPSVGLINLACFLPLILHYIDTHPRLRGTRVA